MLLDETFVKEKVFVFIGIESSAIKNNNRVVLYSGVYI